MSSAMRSRVVTGEPMTATLVVDELLHDGGVCVFRGRTSEGGRVRVVASRALVGRAPGPGETWLVTGAWQTHADYGRQLGATACILTRPDGALLVQALARSPRFPGVGAVRAQRLWDRHGMRLFDLLDNAAAAGAQEASDAAISVLAEELGVESARTCAAGWRELEEEARAYRWLVERGFEPALGRKVLSLYADLPVPDAARREAVEKGRVVWHLEDDPYRMLAFAPWRRVDAAARRMGVPANDPRRLAGAVEAVLARRIAKAHTWMSERDLVAAVARLLGDSRAVALHAIADAVRHGGVVAHAGGYQPAGCHVMERLVAERSAAMVAGRWAAEQIRLESAVTREGVESDLNAFCAREGYPLNPEQRDAVWMALTVPLSCLVGGPGVGKTTVLKAVHDVAERHHRRVVQAALSGRAAQRMAEATGRPAATIAALLLRVERGDESLDDEPHVVIDEASMVDLPTLYRLMGACPPGTRLMLVGDPGQLPPVGFGLTFHLLAEDARIPRTTLTRVMRQTDASGIPHVCRAIRAGEAPALPAWAPGARGGVSFLACEPRDVSERVLDLLATLGPHPDTQVVGSIKPGPGAVDEINYRLHALASVGGTPAAARFFVGQPVIATRNDYDVGVMNGELGVVLGDADGGGLHVRFDAGEKTLPAAYLGDVELAYAITCHKSQGSQFRRVIVPVTPNRLLDRTLLLTAVSRAQEQVVLVGDPAAFAQAVTNPPSSLAREVGLGR